MPSLACPLALFWKPQLEITSVHLCPIAKVLVTGSRSGQVVFWELNQSRVVPRIVASGSGVAITVISEATLDFNEVVVCAADDGTVSIYDSGDGRLLSRVSRRLPPSPRIALALPGRRHIAFTGDHRRIDVVDVEGTKLASTLHGHNDWVCGVTLGDTGLSEPMLISVSLDGELRYWSVPSYNTGSPVVHDVRSSQLPSAPIGVHLLKDRLLLLCVTEWRVLQASTGLCLVLGDHPPSTCPCGHAESSEDSWAGGVLLDWGGVLLWTGRGRAFVFNWIESDDAMVQIVPLFCFACGNALCTPSGPEPRRPVLHYHNGLLIRGDEQGRVAVWNVPSQGSDVMQPITPWNTASLDDGWVVDNEAPQVTAALVSPEDFGGVSVIEGHSTGLITLSPLPPDRPVVRLIGHTDAVTCLLIAKSDHGWGDGHVLVSGSNDCTTRVWHFSQKEARLIRTFSFHAGPVVSLCQPPEEGGSAFSGCFCSVGSDQSVVVATLGPPEPQCVHLLTGHSASIDALRWQATNDHLLVKCEDGTVYVWQLSTGQLDSCLWGTIADQAWRTAKPSDPPSRKARRVKGALAVDSVFMAGDRPNAQVLTMDIKSTISDLLSAIPARQGSSATLSEMLSLRTPSWALARGALLPLLLPWGIDPTLDSACESLSLSRPAHSSLAFGVRGHEGSVTLFTPAASRGLSRWSISSYFTVLQSLSVVALLNALMQADGGEMVTTTCTLVIAHVCTLIPEKVPGYIEPSLALLARYWVDSVDEVQEAARSLFGSTVSDMPHEKRCSLAAQWVPFLPAGDGVYDASANSNLSGRRAVAVLVLSVIASEHSEVLDDRVIARLARELLYSLHLRGVQRLMSIELLGKGFPVWRKHLPDVAVMVQQLFLYSQVADSPPTADAPADMKMKLASVSAHALLVVGAHVPGIFIRVMGHEILRSDTAPSEHISAILALCELIRKSPGPVLNHLPRLIEAVVRALDPNVPSIKEKCLSATITTLHEAVRRYPMASFHQESQRLAVGTVDGGIVMYDLRTASRLLVLEGHEGPVSALAIERKGTVSDWFGVYPLTETCIIL